MYATCETPGCLSEFVPIPLRADHGTVICGVCGVPITHITDTAPEPVKEMPTWA